MGFGWLDRVSGKLKWLASGRAGLFSGEAASIKAREAAGELSPPFDCEPTPLSQRQFMRLVRLGRSFDCQQLASRLIRQRPSGCQQKSFTNGRLRHRTAASGGKGSPNGGRVSRRNPSNACLCPQLLLLCRVAKIGASECARATRLVEHLFGRRRHRSRLTVFPQLKENFLV
jgi:hypothetical protein